MRKLLVGFISLGVVFAAYVLYTGLSDTPTLRTDPGAEFIEPAADSNVGGFDSGVGKIGDVGLGPVRKAKYITLNKETKAVEREWGFEKLLHEDRDFWELEKTYMNVYQRNFKCYITADKGKVRVETAVGRTTPKDATFSGNVVIHVLPEESSDMKESHVYLDDMTFLSERSQLSTAGPVEFVSDDVHMLGTGLEIIFNDQSDRLEFFRIVDLESLRLKGSQAAMFSSGKTETSAETVAQAETEQPDETVVAAGPEKNAGQLPQGARPQIEQKQGVFYECVLSRNVLIETPDELIFADQRILISNIFWSKDSAGLSGEAEPGDVNDTEAVAAAGEEDRDVDPNSFPADNAGDPNVIVAASGEPNIGVPAPGDPNESPDETIEIVVTCDNGLVLVPMDTARSLDEYMQGPDEPAVSAGGRIEQIGRDTERTVFLAPRIDYNAVTGDVVADGFSQLTFYARNSAGAEANEPPVPTKITARDRVEFFQTTNQVVFKGDCQGTMPQDGLTEQRNVTFLSPEITVNLPADKSERPDVLAGGPAKLTFYMQDANDTDAVQDANVPKIPNEPIPVTVTAQKQARFSGATNQIIFEDDCRCTTIREDPNGVTQYLLSSELITVDLPEDTNDRSSKPTARIERLTATGGVVRLATTKTARPDPNQAGYVSDANAVELLGGVELKCSRVDYDPVRGLFVAAGPPAEIRMDNSRVSVTEPEPNALSLSEPCYVLIQNFDTLKYFIGENRIVADAGGSGVLWLQYVPVVDGEYDLDATTIASAPHVEAFLAETADGQTELSTLTATGGIAFDDDTKNSIFLGSKLFYDHKTSIMKITGDASRPCLCNGVLVDEIEYNVTTGKLEFEVVAPGAMQTNE
ncbi:MAG: hypothetical protein ISS70_05720 [Phycisphaerae bacterium]|nr:hypothetical protein [Phycisphaerae bacterium]